MYTSGAVYRKSRAAIHAIAAPGALGPHLRASVAGSTYNVPAAIG
jgi:hypothetical protein